MGAIHLTHPTGADLGDDSVVAERLADHGDRAYLGGHFRSHAKTS